MFSFEDDHETMETYYSKQSEGREDVEKENNQGLHIFKQNTHKYFLQVKSCLFMSFPIKEVQNTSRFT